MLIEKNDLMEMMSNVSANVGNVEQQLLRINEILLPERNLLEELMQKEKIIEKELSGKVQNAICRDNQIQWFRVAELGKSNTENSFYVDIDLKAKSVPTMEEWEQIMNQERFVRDKLQSLSNEYQKVILPVFRFSFVMKTNQKPDLIRNKSRILELLKDSFENRNNLKTNMERLSEIVFPGRDITKLTTFENIQNDFRIIMKYDIPVWGIQVSEVIRVNEDGNDFEADIWFNDVEGFVESYPILLHEIQKLTNRYGIRFAIRLFIRQQVTPATTNLECEEKK